MAVAHDAATESSTWTTTPDPFTFAHTPTGTPRGVLVLIVHQQSSDEIDGVVSYGGLAMARIVTAADTAGEESRSYAYFLGEGVPAGVQTVSIAHASTASATKKAVCITVTAAGDTEIGASGVDQENQANPAVVLDTTTESSLRYCCIFSGLPEPTDLTMLSGMTAVHDLDRGTNVDRQDRQTSAASGSFTIGYTSASDDVAMVAVAIQEIGRYFPFFVAGLTDVGLLMNASKTAITKLRGTNNGTSSLVLQLKSGANTYDLTVPADGVRTELILSPTISITEEDSENWLGAIDSLTIRPS